jgi:hypothetical protein
MTGKQSIDMLELGTHFQITAYRILISKFQLNAMFRGDGLKIQRVWSLFYATIVPT